MRVGTYIEIPWTLVSEATSTIMGYNASEVKIYNALCTYVAWCVLKTKNILLL
jgi:hypothetical protein